CQEKIIEIINFKSTKTFGFKQIKPFNTFSQDKGHKNELEAFFNSLETNQESPISFEEIVQSTQSAFQALKHITD
ncbi:hypothetical protein DID80_02535, partial [Candidatus Marinamargulisbacteria bacterium SCGC AAA071-K20]